MFTTKTGGMRKIGVLFTVSEPIFMTELGKWRGGVMESGENQIRFIKVSLLGFDSLDF